MKRIILLTLLAVISAGCANPAQISKPVLADLNSNVWNKKTLAYKVNYAQPTPGIFSGGDVVELQPISQVQKSIYSSRILSNLDNNIKDTFPDNLLYSESEVESDYKMQIDITAFDKKGPSYSDYLSLVNWSKFFLTLGINKVQDYEIIADFKMNCRLYDKQDSLIFEKDYTVKDVLEHEEYSYNLTSSYEALAAELFKKHVSVSMNDFFKNFEYHQLANSEVF